MNTSIASDERWGTTASESATLLDSGIDKRAYGGEGRRSRLTIRGLLEDLVLALLLVLLCPLAILLIGTPVALFVRLLIEIAERL